ncbi:MAG: signal peptide peptidase SppA [Desulfovibrio sp.]|nr:signal peptide peptidase SppA [Desulfovibrio sp.]MBI4960239.1 signal peptide peptidase SppA [Desulfovibrio sp.]
MPARIVLSLMLILATAAGCSPRLSLFGDPASTSLTQSVLEGSGSAKVLVLPVSGFIGLGPRQGLLSSRPGTVQEATAILRKAAKDKNVKALVLLIDSPGGTVAGTDMLFKEIEAYKASTHVKVVAQAMTVCASGGYYLALAADEIQATPASVVGSVGTLFVSPKLAGLMGKIGVDAEVTKSGSLKDMGSPFRASTEEERRITQEMIDQMNAMFLELLASKRKLSRSQKDEAARAGVYAGGKAKELGLVDRLGYPRDALARAKALAGVAENAKVVVYRRSKYEDDTYYNAATGQWGGEGAKTLGVSIGLESLGMPVDAGFYYLWPQALPEQWR